MNTAQYNRYVDFRGVQNDLTQPECCDATDFDAWMNSWRLYVKNGGDRPPVKPPTP